MIHHDSCGAICARCGQPFLNSADDAAGPPPAEGIPVDTKYTEDDPRYSGWSNYATWRVSIELVDDLIVDLVKDIRAGDAEPFLTTDALADHLEEEVHQIVSFYGALDRHPGAAIALSYAWAFLLEVDFWEIAERASLDYPEMIAPHDEEADTE